MEMFFVFTYFLILKTRGHNGPGAWIVRDMANEPNKAKFIWLLNIGLKVECLYISTLLWHGNTKFDKL